MLEVVVAVLLSNATATAAGAEAASGMTEPDPKVMTASQIREHNSRLTRQHPYFIRCVKSANVGSLVARSVSCRTNWQWAIADRSGNDEARDVGDKTASKFWDFERAGP